MTMHLVGPWLSTTGKKKGKKKWASAEAKRRSEALEQEWQDIKKRHHTSQEIVKKKIPLSATVLKSTPPIHRGANDPKPKSLSTWTTGAVSSKPSPQYTGTAVMGITILHKSCLQPVFNQQEAIDAATMRR